MTRAAIATAVKNAQPVKAPSAMSPDPAKTTRTNGAAPQSLPETKRPRLLDAGVFLGEFKPIESIIDGLPVPRGGIVSVTGPTGSGKTTLCCAIQLVITFASKFAGREATGGSVLVLAGENPDDYAMHLMATLQQAGLAAGELCKSGCPQLLVVPGVFDVLHEIDWLHEKVEKLGVALTAVFVDTSAAYCVGDDENDNVSMRRHASASESFARCQASRQCSCCAIPPRMPARTT